jgi:glycosyltransferase involved in cell wall biosynthesis
MKLIINTVNLKIGGAFQRSLSFLNELKEIGKDEYHIFYNEDISKQLDITDFPANFKFYFFDHSPAPLKYRKKIVAEFNKIEKQINPDVVFSFVGPCYWRAHKPHLVGFAIYHIVYDNYEYVRKFPFITKLEMLYKKFWTKKEADYYVVQTEDVRKQLSKKIKVDKNKIFVVSNSCGKQYENITVLPPPNGKTKKLLMISIYRPNKNFEIMKEVFPYLEKDEYDYEFHITIRQEDYDAHFKGCEDRIINHGHVAVKDCPALYNQSDAMILPSHLECFSASYPEAMKMKRPILTSNLSFATTVCGDAALYFDNTNLKDIADKIIMLFHNQALYDDLVKKGEERLLVFDNTRQQAEKYLEICKKISKLNH